MSKSDPLIIPLSFSSPPLSLNGREHWATKARTVQSLRQEAMIRVRALHLPQQDHITVGLHYRPRDRRRRDPSNLIATQKPLLDGTVDAGLVADDSPNYVTEHMPRIHPPEKGQGGKCWLEIQLNT